MGIDNQNMDIPYLELSAPFRYYRHLTGNDQMHFGYWPDGDTAVSLTEAQRNLTDLLLERLPKNSCRILDVGCGLGATAEFLYGKGHEVTAIAPSEHMIDYARSIHPGPNYIVTDFMENHEGVSNRYDVIILQESLQYFPDLRALFKKIKNLLAPRGRVLMCDEVSYSLQTRGKSAVHAMQNIELYLAEAGLVVSNHKKIGDAVINTCKTVLELFQQNMDQLLTLFGPEKKGEIQALRKGWQQQYNWYQTGKFGYEIWDLRPSRLTTSLYKQGDETKILELFHSAFHVERSIKHWRWKYLENPFGGPCIANVWDHDQLAAHYAGYSIPFYMEGEFITFQVGDTMTNPSYRSEGRGFTSTLARACRLFRRYYCEEQLPIWYGFNTGKIQKFGKLFLEYHIPCPVYEWIADKKVVMRLSGKPAWINMLKGITCNTAVTFEWADSFYENVKDSYKWLVKRSGQYLQWRFHDHPDQSHTITVVRKWGRVAGYLVTRVENNELLIGDALFNPDEPGTFEVALCTTLKYLENKDYPPVNRIRGWFSLTPSWWIEIVEKTGFIKHREKNHLDLCITLSDKRFTVQDVAENMYFTWADSDLF